MISLKVPIGSTSNQPSHNLLQHEVISFEVSDNFIAQVVGRKRILMKPASEVGKLYNAEHVFSQVGDLESPNLGADRFPRLQGLRLYAVDLAPGEILFTPLAWWHQVRALDFSVTLTYTNFRWDNGAFATYPS
jgi:ribosomal protein L16 Arg81 hydroxylase